MGALARLCVLCGIIGLLHVGRYLAEMLYYHHCASTIYALLFTSGSSTCVALRTVSTNMTTNMATFAGVILNSVLRSLADAPTADYDLNVRYCMDAARRFSGRQPPIPPIQNADDAPHM